MAEGSAPCQGEYEGTWRDQMPEALAESNTAELLEGACATSTSTPSTSSCRGGFGRD